MRIKSQKVLLSFENAGRCEFCETPCLQRERHHIHTRGAGWVDLRCNIIMLGGPFRCACHAKFHNGGICRAEFLTVVAARDNTTVEAIETLIYLVRRLPKDAGKATIWEAIEQIDDHIARRLARNELSFVGLI